jgi:polysaccharide export outer membrane protein
MINHRSLKRQFYGYALLGLLLFSSACTSTRKLNYFDDFNTGNSFTIEKENQTQRIIKGDILSIIVSSANPQSDEPFNTANFGGTMRGGGMNQMAGTQGYFIEEDGTFNFPRLGKIVAAGKTKSILVDELTQQLQLYLKDPAVTIRTINFRVTVLGEVARPGTYITTNERMTLLEALGQAGDLTDFGKRDNVLIIRETDQEQQHFRINLNDRASITQELYYLRPNDLVYIEPIPNKRIRSSNFSQVSPLVISTLSFVMGLLVYFR